MLTGRNCRKGILARNNWKEMPPVNKWKLLFMTCFTHCKNNFKKESEPQEKLKPPSVANLKNSISILQKHILRGKERLYELRNLVSTQSRREKHYTLYRRQHVCIIKVL